MWKGYENALGLYMNVMISEWVCRGYNNTMKIVAVDLDDLQVPEWLGDDQLHASHRSNLLRKDSKYYSQFGWTEPHDLPYIWPVQ